MTYMIDWKELDRIANWYRYALKEAMTASAQIADAARQHEKQFSTLQSQIEGEFSEAARRLRVLPDLSTAVNDVERLTEAYRAATAIPSEVALSAARTQLREARHALSSAPWKQMADSLSAALGSLPSLRSFETTFQGQILELAGRFETADTPGEAEAIVGQVGAILLVVVEMAPSSARTALVTFLLGVVYPLLLFLASQTSAQKDFERIHEQLLSTEQQIRQVISDRTGADPLAAAYLTTTETQVHLEPRADSKIVSRLPGGSAVRKLDERGHWAEVEFVEYPLAQATTGWARSDHLTAVGQ